MRSRGRFFCAIIADGIVVIEWTRNVLGSKTKGLGKIGSEKGLGLIKNRTAMKCETGGDDRFSLFLPAENICSAFNCHVMMSFCHLTRYRLHPKIAK